MEKGEKVQQTGHCWQGSPGIVGQLCSLQELAPSDESESISTLLQVFVNEKATSGNTEKHNIRTKHALNKRTRFNFIPMIVKLKEI